MEDKPCEAYITHLSVTKSAETTKTFGAMLRRFQTFINSYGCTLHDFTAEDVLEYIQTKDTWSPNTQNLFLATVKGFARYSFARIEMGTDLEGMQHAFAEQRRLNLIKQMGRFKVPQTIQRKALTMVEFAELLHVAHERGSPRTWKRIWLMFYLGARKIELRCLSLDKRTFDPSTGRLVLATAKGMSVLKERLLWVEPKGTLGIMKEVAAGDLDFGTNSETLNKMLKYTQEMTDIEISVSPHTARHTFITEMRKTLNDNILLKRLAGHSSGSDMTAVYTSYEEKDIKKAMVDNHYLRKMFPMIHKWMQEDKQRGQPRGDTEKD